MQGIKTLWPTKTSSDVEQSVVAKGDRSGTLAQRLPGVAGQPTLMERKWARSPEELVEIYSDEVWRYASSQIPRREDAEDITMEVFAAACANFAKLGRVDDQRLWLLGVARNRVANYLRKKYRRAEQPLTDTHTAPVIENTELQEAVRVGIGSLDRLHAEVLVLKYVNGLATGEISQVIRKSLPATNSLLQRARAAFRESIGTVIAEDAGSKS